MRMLLIGCLLAATLPGADRVVMDLEKTPHAKVKNVPVSAVTMREGFWQSRMKVNVERSIPTLLELLESNGIIDNFRRLAGKNVARRGPLFTDSDIYKWMEAAAFVLQSQDDPKLRATFDKLTDEILAAQEPSGYLNTYWVEDRKDRRWKEQQTGHELYCLGHMLQAGIAYYRATGNRKLMDGGIKFVEHLLRDFGPSKQPLYAGHPEIELALIELYRTTGRKEFLDLAGSILKGDGERLKLTRQQTVYTFSGRPFTDRTIVEGHAVRFGYAASGATDYYMETGDPAYKATLERLWKDLTETKMYVTGGTGSRASGETFGDAYELPNAKAYTESCAAIANLMWNWRMLAATGEARFADIVETTMYNSINSGMSLDGTMYCYRNPLELTEEASKRIRNPWYVTTCCPPNLERMLASLPGYMYGVSKQGLWVHLYDNNRLDWRLEGGAPVKLTQTTKYPWQGKVALEIEEAPVAEFSIFLRIPGWAKSAAVSVGGRKAQGEPRTGGYFEVRRAWKKGDTVELNLDMTPQVLKSHPLVADNQGRAAVRRGPVVYLLEQAGQAPGVNVLESYLNLTGNAAADFRENWDPGLLGGIVTLKHRGRKSAAGYESMPLYGLLEESKDKPGEAAELVFTPYYTFLNRGPSAMQVWVRYVKK
ncbi:MAG: glycoside hydrolase family 127 protein [Bryobacteraceae bacterium]|nr:glycoside hydrolase family 127 protein [Bryobacteraceae bacterium]